MSNTQPAATPNPSIKPQKRQNRLTNYEWILMVLMALAIIGVGMTYFYPDRSYRYWLAIVPVFGVACLSLEWARLKSKGKGFWPIIKDQFYHWSGVLVSVYLVYLLFNAQQLNNQNAGLVVLLVLALATFLAGIQLGWRLYLLGGFLWLVLLMAAYLTGYLWVLILGGTLIMAIYIYWRIRTGQGPQSEPETGVRPARGHSQTPRK
jgi:hypothetical protein